MLAHHPRRAHPESQITKVRPRVRVRLLDGRAGESIRQRLAEALSFMIDLQSGKIS
jgi:hypothetical protein